MARLADGQPAVTVLLPVRNGAAHLRAAVGSVLGQSFAGFELVVVDDGSTDGTGAILARLAGEDARVRVVRQAALGLTRALNRGLQEARAPLVARMDADDVAAPERLARQMELLASRPEVALVGTGWRVVAAEGVVRRVVLPPETDAGIRVGMAERNVLAHPTVMFRRDAVLGAGGYRAAFLLAEDYDLWLRLLEGHAAAWGMGHGLLPPEMTGFPARCSPEVSRHSSPTRSTANDLRLRGDSLRNADCGDFRAARARQGTRRRR